jgi:hypothetical protein
MLNDKLTRSPERGNGAYTLLRGGAGRSGRAIVYPEVQEAVASLKSTGRNQKRPALLAHLQDRRSLPLCSRDQATSIQGDVSLPQRLGVAC